MAQDEAGGPLPTPRPVPGHDVTLESYYDDRHGVQRLEVSPRAIGGRYVSVPRPHESWRAGPVTVVDDFTLDLGRNALL